MKKNLGLVSIAIVTSLVVSCNTDSVISKGQSDSGSDTDTDSDTGSETETDSDSLEPCPCYLDNYQCVSEALCNAMGGVVHEEYQACDESSVCCELPPDTDTDTGTDTETDGEMSAVTGAGGSD